MFSLSEHLLSCDALSSCIGEGQPKPLLGFGGRDGSIQVFPFDGYTRTAWLQGLADSVTALTFDPNQSSVIGGSDTGALQLWDVASEEVACTFDKKHTSTITDINYVTSNRFFATASTDKVLRLWDASKPSARQAYKESSSPLCAAQFSPTGKWVVSGCSSGILRLYDIASGKLEKEFATHSSAITSIHFHPHLYYMAASSSDGAISVVNLETYEVLFQSCCAMAPVDAVCFCGNRVIAVSEHRLCLYDLDNLKEDSMLSIDAPWTMMGDVKYVAEKDEAWFVETSGPRATKYKLPLSQLSKPLSKPAAPTAASHSTTPTVVQTAELKNYPRRGTPTISESKSAPQTPPPPRPPRRQQKKETPEQLSLPGHQPDIPHKAGWNSGGISLPEMPSVTASGSESSLLEKLQLTHVSVNGTLQRRLANARILRSLWLQNQREAVSHLKQLCDDGCEFGPLFDFLTVMQQQRMKEKMSMDVVPAMVELIEIALGVVYDPLVLLGLRLLRSVVIRFRAAADEGQRRARTSQSTGYNDPLGLNRHREISQKLGECSVVVLSLAELHNAVGDEARRLIAEMPPPPRTE